LPGKREARPTQGASEVPAWGDVIEPPLPGRLAKPRGHGLTMVIDKGLGLTATRDLLEVGAPYIDFLKLAFGTSALCSERFLRAKIDLVRSHGVEVYPGGTFLEIALLQGRLAAYLSRACELGFRFVEVSDGTIELDRSQRSAAIRAATGTGLHVISEVGKKDPLAHCSPSWLREQVEADLGDGAGKVIVEGRESGLRAGVYDEQGRLREEDLAVLAEGLDPALLVWEAPLKAQQEALILRYGPNVNLGNIPPAEVLALEALRRGLRGDTLRAALPAGSAAVQAKGEC
jgi:phosphosulfolactate synthase